MLTLFNISFFFSYKVNTPVMLLRNLDPKNGHCNGTRYLLTNISPNLLEATMLTGERAGSTLLLPRINMAPGDTDLPFRMRRRQFPVRPAFSMTINKSQGQTLKTCGLFLPSSVFAHGQLYVAASRVSDPNNLSVYVASKDCHTEETDDKTILTRNVVYPEVL